MDRLTGASGPLKHKGNSRADKKRPRPVEPSFAKTQSADLSEKNYGLLLTQLLNDVWVPMTLSRFLIGEIERPEQTWLIIPPSR